MGLHNEFMSITIILKYYSYIIENKMMHIKHRIHFFLLLHVLPQQNHKGTQITESEDAKTQNSGDTKNRFGNTHSRRRRTTSASTSLPQGGEDETRIEDDGYNMADRCRRNV